MELVISAISVIAASITIGVTVVRLLAKYRAHRVHVESKTGQILPANEFVTAYGKNKLTTPLNTKFYGREDELQKALEALSGVTVLILTGPAGVGKSRIALEVARRFEKAHPEYRTWCLLNRGLDFFEDLRSSFSRKGSFLIVADDANRLSNFEYIIYLLQDRQPGQHFKVIATVRDYALDRVRRTAMSYGSYSEIAIAPFEDKEIAELVETEFGITSYHYLSQIKRVARGNPRLAVMAAQLARDANTLESIRDVSQLYELYFGSIREDIEELGDPSLLRVAGVVAFFRVVDRSHTEMMAAIEAAFEIAPDVFWEKSLVLHELEVFDMYANEVVRTSDQVLATYLFYRAFFEVESLDFSTVLEYFFPALRDRLVDALNPVFQAFNAPRLKEVMAPHVRRRWQALAEAPDKKSLRQFMDLFWFFDPTRCLLYVREAVDALETEDLNARDVTLETDKEPLPREFSLLKRLRHGDENTVSAAVTLALDWAEKRPSDAGVVLRLLQKDYGFSTTSYLAGHRVQRIVLDLLWKRADEGRNILISRLFVGVASEFLNTDFEEMESETRWTVTFTQFQLPHVPATTYLRKTMWERLFALHRTGEYLRADVLRAIEGYCRAGHRVASKLLMTEDVALLGSFFQSEFDRTNYRHCVIVQTLIDRLDREKISYDQSLRETFTNTTYQVSRLLLDDWSERHNLDLGYREYEQLRRQRLAGYLSDFVEEDYEELFDHCRMIRDELGGREGWQFDQAVVTIFDITAERDTNLFRAVLARYLTAGEDFQVQPWGVVEKLLTAISPDEALSLLMSTDYATKNRWLFAYYHLLAKEHITHGALEALYGLYKNAAPEQIPLAFDPLVKYRGLEPRVVPRVVEILISRLEKTPELRPFTLLFNSRRVASQEIVELFKEDLELLKRAYLANAASDPHADYNSQILSRIVDEDQDFLLEFVEWKLADKEWISRHDDSRGYAFIWRRSDAATLMTKVAERIKELEQERLSLLSYTSLGALFNVREGSGDLDQIEARQDSFLHEIIRKYARNADWMCYVFRVIGDLAPERRLASLKVFLEENKNVGTFRRLSLEPSSWGWTGSAVPTLQGRIDFWGSVLRLLDSPEYLDHRHVVEGQIAALRDEIEREKKRDFMEDR